MQPLLVPVELHGRPARCRDRRGEPAKSLRQIGFDMAPGSPTTLIVRAVPAALAEADARGARRPACCASCGSTARAAC